MLILNSFWEKSVFLSRAPDSFDLFMRLTLLMLQSNLYEMPLFFVSSPWLMPTACPGSVSFISVHNTTWLLPVNTLFPFICANLGRSALQRHLGDLLLEVRLKGRRPRGKARTHGRDCVSQLAWRHLGNLLSVATAKLQREMMNSL